MRKNLPFTKFYMYYRDFVSYAGYKFYVLIILMLLSGLVESIGIGLFIPILNHASPQPLNDSFSKSLNQLFDLFNLDINLTTLLFTLIIVFTIKGCLLYIQVLATTKISTDLTMDLRIRLSKKYSVMDYSYFIDKTAGYLNNLITTEVTTAVNGLNKYCELIGYIIYISVYLCFASFLNFKMTLFVLMVIIILFFPFKTLYRLTVKNSKEVTNLNALMQSSLIQIIYNFKYLKATNSFKVLIRMFSKHIQNNSKVNFKLGAIGGVFSSIVEPLVVIFMSIIIIYYVVINKHPLSEIMIILIFFHKTFTRVFNLQSSWQKFNAAIGGVDAVKKAQVEIDNNMEQVVKKNLFMSTGEIILNKVSYSYGNNTVLSDLCMNIPHNKSIAIVGESGAGKTTFFDLLTGLLEPKSGTITINGVDYRNVDKDLLRSKIGYVTQEAVVFNDTVANNISFWKNSYEEDVYNKIVQAADMAYCSSFISELSEGFNTVIGDKGTKLSGGQRQRIAIAREIFKEPEILIFDEATSSLDTKSELYIQKSIESLMGKCTIIIIAHRLSTIKNCDYIFVLSKGKLIEQGTFSHLNSIESSIFRQMCKAQNIGI